jgi:hypothetical protein
MTEAMAALTSWERALMAVQNVKDRLRRATEALDRHGVPYAVAGGNAVADWVARVDEGAVRNTKDVDILVRRNDFAAVKSALESAGFIHHHLIDIEVFVDGPQGRPSDGVHLLFAGEKVKRDDPHTLPHLEESERGNEFQVVSLESIVRMKLMSFRLKDRVHLIDLIHVGQIDATWPARFPADLGKRLQELLDNPDG